MQEQLKTLRLTNPEVFFLSLGGIGFIKIAPGTFGTLATLPFLYFLMIYKIPSLFLIPFLLGLTSASCLMANYAEKKYQLHDPSWIVIDEAIGIAIAWLFVSQQNLISLAIIFILFRFFDIVKFGPVAYFDRMTHGAGTILDDVAAGFMSGFVFLMLEAGYEFLS